MMYYVVTADAQIQMMDGLDLHTAALGVYAISESERTAKFNALRCVNAAIARLEAQERPGVGGWWLEELKKWERRREDMLSEGALG